MTLLPGTQQSGYPDVETQSWAIPDDLLPGAEPLPPARPYAPAAVTDLPLPEPEPFPGPATEPSALAVADPGSEPTPTQEFLADWRDLPVFRLTARVKGWCGHAARKVRRPAPAPAVVAVPEVYAPVPGGFLRAAGLDGQTGDLVRLDSLPVYAGTDAASDGTVFAGVALDVTGDGQILADSADPAYWRAWIAAGHAALDSLTGGAR
jgi:hypothetical protein